MLPYLGTLGISTTPKRPKRNPACNAAEPSRALIIKAYLSVSWDEVGKEAGPRRGIG
jgi:hypothetical protein